MSLNVFGAVFAEYIHHVAVVGTLFVAHFAGLAVGVAFDGLEHLSAAAFVEDAVDFIERFGIEPTQGARPLALIDRCETAVDFAVVVVNPLPYGALFGM